MTKTSQRGPTGEDQFRLLVQSVTDYAIYMLDPTGIVASWNAGAERFKGYRAEEILGQHFSRFYSEEDRAVDLPGTALATARNEGRFEAEGWRIRKDGSRFWANVVIDPVRNAAGDLIGFAKVTRDLTERRETQLALEQAREAFFQSQKMDALGKLTGGVAHDFNNLLAVVIGSLDLARRRIADGGDALRLIDNAIKAAERGAGLTQHMLAFARRQELKLETVDTGALIAGMADMLQRTIGAGVLIETRAAPHLRAARADPSQLELALLNLAVNARDAMPDGGRLTITAHDEHLARERDGLAPGRYVRLEVADEGEGMDEATMKRAMEPFFTTKGIGKGTGLGLSMVHGFAEQCGGTLTLASRRGEGTRAAIWLRAADEGEREQAAAAPEVAKGSARLAILAVDDDALVLTNTVAILEDLGHDVVPASSGARALALLRERAFDLLLTDYAMPAMTGAELADAARALHATLPVLIVSGYAELPAVTLATLPRLSKPFRRDDLARAIGDVVGG